ncbi:hypothetical protein RUM44_001568 [Polyplax serrata]|uniref:Uncharacterized protein n=1 Tax=Polyplax serrata TaxID=468196 RepID=A0ABR1AKD7_POLSC
MKSLVVQKIASCERGCRFYKLVLHATQKAIPIKDSVNVKERCHLSCHKAYRNPFEILACNFGCSFGDTARHLCNSAGKEIPQITYSVLIEESDVLIHPGEPELDDSLTDPGLRKQFEKTLEALFDTKSKIPEIHFRNLPIKNDKPPATEYSHVNLKCPKFYGFDSKFEFRNGKIIIGDLYLFVGVFVFVIICFLLGHHIEARSMAKQLAEAKAAKKEDFEDREPLLKSDVEDHYNFMTENDSVPPAYSCQTSHPILESVDSGPDTRFDGTTLVFHDDNGTKSHPCDDNTLKI